MIAKALLPQFVPDDSACVVLDLRSAVSYPNDTYDRKPHDDAAAYLGYLGM